MRDAMSLLDQVIAFGGDEADAERRRARARRRRSQGPARARDGARRRGRGGVPRRRRAARAAGVRPRRTSRRTSCDTCATSSSPRSAPDRLERGRRDRPRFASSSISPTRRSATSLALAPRGRRRRPLAAVPGLLARRSTTSCGAASRARRSRWRSCASRAGRRSSRSTSSSSRLGDLERAPRRRAAPQRARTRRWRRRGRAQEQPAPAHAPSIRRGPRRERRDARRARPGLDARTYADARRPRLRPSPAPAPVPRARARARRLRPRPRPHPRRARPTRQRRLARRHRAAARVIQAPFAAFFEHAVPLEVTAARVVVGFEPSAAFHGRPGQRGGRPRGAHAGCPRTFRRADAGRSRADGQAAERRPDRRIDRRGAADGGAREARAAAVEAHPARPGGDAPLRRRAARRQAAERRRIG